MTDQQQWQRWIEGLCQPRHALHVRLFGHMRVASDWRRNDRLPEHLVYFVSDGYAQGTAGGGAIELEPWSLLWLPPGLPFSLAGVAGRAPLRLYHLRFHIAGLPAPVRTTQLLRGVRDLHPLMAQIFDEQQARLPLQEQAFRAGLALVFTQVHRHVQRRLRGPTLESGKRTRLQRLVDRRLGDGLGPSDLAACCAMSPAYFARVFRRTYGRAPRSWLVEERVRRAALLLEESDAGLETIAEQLGFPDRFCFSRQFKQVLGLSPSAWRHKR